MNSSSPRTIDKTRLRLIDYMTNKYFCMLCIKNHIQAYTYMCFIINNTQTARSIGHNKYNCFRLCLTVCSPVSLSEKTTGKTL